MAISVFPFLIAAIDDANSGKEVPIANTVKPITLSEIPNDLAIIVAPSTIKFPPITNPVSPKIKIY